MTNKQYAVLLGLYHEFYGAFNALPFSIKERFFDKLHSING